MAKKLETPATVKVFQPGDPVPVIPHSVEVKKAAVELVRASLQQLGEHKGPYWVQIIDGTGWSFDWAPDGFGQKGVSVGVKDLKK
jgi:hypothetical protein